MYNYCEKCVTDKSYCSVCRSNPEVQRILMSLPHLSHFQAYIPVCPRGYLDCIYDPAYIHFHYPDWYKELYGDLTPEEAINVPNGCMARFINDPDEKHYCYDDEDK